MAYSPITFAQRAISARVYFASRHVTDNPNAASDRRFDFGARSFNPERLRRAFMAATLSNEEPLMHRNSSTLLAAAVAAAVAATIAGSVSAQAQTAASANALTIYSSARPGA